MNENYIYMVPIKFNHHPNRYPPSDHAEMKSQPFKLQKITTLAAVRSSSVRFPSAGGYLHYLRKSRFPT
ncbi:hypothetical protein Hanom_Chr01g00002201 [Helianthus anomalus]